MCLCFIYDNKSYIWDVFLAMFIMYIKIFGISLWSSRMPISTWFIICRGDCPIYMSKPSVSIGFPENMGTHGTRWYCKRPYTLSSCQLFTLYCQIMPNKGALLCTPINHCFPGPLHSIMNDKCDVSWYISQLGSLKRQQLIGSSTSYCRKYSFSLKICFLMSCF